MTIKTNVCNDYTRLNGTHLYPTDCSVANNTTENLDQYRKPFYGIRNTCGVFQNFPLSAESSMIDEFHSTSEVTAETSWEEELSPKYEFCRHIHSDNDWSLKYNSTDAVVCLATPTMTTSWLGVGEPTAGMPGRGENNFDRELSMDLAKEDYLRLMVPRNINMWSPPPSPIFQSSPSQIEDLSELQSVFSIPMLQFGSIIGQDNGIELFEKTFNETTDGSFLFVTTNRADKLLVLLRERGIEVQDIGKTRTPGILVVLFKTHEFAKRAFTTQREIGIRMVPPKYTKKYWFKNPSPNFPVIFETSRRLTVKAGKSSTNEKIGDFLMMDAKKGNGCLVLADQMKGHRLRVVGYIGKFMNKYGRIIEQTSMSKQKIIGWISTKSYKNKQKFVHRRSMNKIGDYVHYDRFQVVE